MIAERLAATGLVLIAVAFVAWLTSEGATTRKVTRVATRTAVMSSAASVATFLAAIWIGAAS